jgi:two-component sensor histidine kinase
MALIHEKLYKSRFLSNINIREYINDISVHLFSSYSHISKNIKLNLDVEDLELGVDKCIAIGLILNELISNSLKHGFSGETQGEIYIYLHTSDDHKLLLVYSDNGKGMPGNFNFRDSETLGLQLVISLIEQHGGTIEMESCKGVKFTITINI